MRYLLTAMLVFVGASSAAQNAEKRKRLTAARWLYTRLGLRRRLRDPRRVAFDRNSQWIENLSELQKFIPEPGNSPRRLGRAVI